MNGLNLPIRDCCVPQEQERNGDLFRGGKGILPGQGSSFVPCRGVAFEVPGMQCVVQPWTVNGVTNMIKTQIRQAHAIERELGSDDAAIKGRITGRSWRRACAKALLRAGASQERAGQRMHCTGTNAAYYGTEESALFSPSAQAQSPPTRPQLQLHFETDPHAHSRTHQHLWTRLWQGSHCMRRH